MSRRDQYRRTGLHVRVLPKGAVPELLARIADVGVSAAELTPVELAAREWRNEVLEDLGGPGAVSAARRALVGAAVGSKILLDSIDRYLFELAAADRLVNRRSRRVFAIVADRMRVADSLARQLQTLGLERRAKKALDLDAYVARAYGPREGAGEPHADASGAAVGPEREDPEGAKGLSAEERAEGRGEAGSGPSERV